MGDSDAKPQVMRSILRKPGEPFQSKGLRVDFETAVIVVQKDNGIETLTLIDDENRPPIMTRSFLRKKKAMEEFEKREVKLPPKPPRPPGNYTPQVEAAKQPIFEGNLQLKNNSVPVKLFEEYITYMEETTQRTINISEISCSRPAPASVQLLTASGPVIFNAESVEESKRWFQLITTQKKKISPPPALVESQQNEMSTEFKIENWLDKFTNENTEENEMEVLVFVENKKKKKKEKEKKKRKIKKENEENQEKKKEEIQTSGSMGNQSLEHKIKKELKEQKNSFSSPPMVTKKKKRKKFDSLPPESQLSEIIIQAKLEVISEKSPSKNEKTHIPEHEKKSKQLKQLESEKEGPEVQIISPKSTPSVKRRDKNKKVKKEKEEIQNFHEVEKEIIKELNFSYEELIENDLMRQQSPSRASDTVSFHFTDNSIREKKKPPRTTSNSVLSPRANSLRRSSFSVPDIQELIVVSAAKKSRKSKKKKEESTEKGEREEQKKKRSTSKKKTI